MPVKNVVLFSEPRSHGLIYGSCHFKALAKVAPDYVNVVETDGTVSENDETIETKDPVIFYSVGHGQCCIHSVECIKPYIETKDYHCDVHFRCWHFTYDCDVNRRMHKFKGRVVHLSSCVTGQYLGPDLVEKGGAAAFLGYDHLFVYGVWKRGTPEPPPCTEPDDIGDCNSFDDSDCEGERAMILHGNSVGDAADAIIKKFEEYISKYEEGEWKDRWIAPHAVRYLKHDRDHLTSLGDMTFVPCPAITPPIPLWLPIAVGMGLSGMLIGGIAGYSEEISMALGIK